MQDMQHSKNLCGTTAKLWAACTLHEECPKCSKYAHLLNTCQTRRYWHCSCCGHNFSILKEDQLIRTQINVDDYLLLKEISECLRVTMAEALHLAISEP